MLEFLAKYVFRFHEAIPRWVMVDEHGPNYAYSQTTYLMRYMLLPRNRWFNVFLHQFFLDDEEGLHDHPCDFLLVGLRGWYWEDSFQGMRARHAGSVRIMTAEHFHRITVPMYLRGRVWTLAIRGPNRKPWGFLEPGAEELWTRYQEVK